MTKLYLVTGFLGAGKTTLLKELIRQLAPARLSVIVNEFGREGIDGELLRAVGIAVAEINNGSIFCSCRLDQFEDALCESMKSAPEIILVEASGLSDPSNIERIMEQEKFSEIAYQGSLCLVDAVRFEKVVSTARVCKKQLSVSRLVIINKTDLVDAARLEEIRGLLRQLAPMAAVYETSYGKIDPQLLGEMGRTGCREDLLQEKDVSLQRRMIVLNDQISREQLEKFVGMFLEDTYRVKGFVRCKEGVYLVDCVGENVSIAPYEGAVEQPGRLVALAGDGMPMTKSIVAAAKWYPEYVAAIK